MASSAESDTRNIDVIIETPKESRIKFKLDNATGDYIVNRILPP